jgi:hypothetical protein
MPAIDAGIIKSPSRRDAPVAIQQDARPALYLAVEGMSERHAKHATEAWLCGQTRNYG